MKTLRRFGLALVLFASPFDHAKAMIRGTYEPNTPVDRLILNLATRLEQRPKEAASAATARDRLKSRERVLRVWCFEQAADRGNDAQRANIVSRS